VKYEIIEVPHLSGKKAKIYSILPEGERNDLFTNFLSENAVKYKDEVREIVQRLAQMGRTAGFREGFFKHEGDKIFTKKHGKVVWTLYDLKKSNLRLYCIKISGVAIILGSGGPKSKSTRTWQDDPKLSNEVNKLMAYAECIFQQMDEKTLMISKDGSKLEGNLKNY
jgi:hypothetical protein